MASFLKPRPSVAGLLVSEEAEPWVPSDQDEIACYYVVTMHGTVTVGSGDEESTFAAFDLDVWHSKDDADQGEPPVWRDSHMLQLSVKPGADHGEQIRRAIEASIRSVSHRDGSGDERDPRWRQHARKQRLANALRLWDGRTVEMR